MSSLQDKLDEVCRKRKVLTAQMIELEEKIRDEKVAALLKNKVLRKTVWTLRSCDEHSVSFKANDPDILDPENITPWSHDTIELPDGVNLIFSDSRVFLEGAPADVVRFIHAHNLQVNIDLLMERIENLEEDLVAVKKLFAVMAS